MLIIILLQMLFAISLIFLKKISFVEFPIFITGTRLFFGGIIALTLSFIFDGKKNMLYYFKKEWKLFLAVAFINSFMSNSLGQYGAKFLSASIISLIQNLMPFATAIICFIFLNEKISKMKWFSLVFGFIGFIPVLLIGESINLTSIKQNFFSEVTIIFSMLTNAIGWILIKRLVYNKKVSIMFTNGITLFLGGFFAIISSLFVENLSLDSLNNSQMWLFNLLIALNTYVICYALYSKALKLYSPTFVSFTSFLATIFTAILGYIFINEEISTLLIISIFIMILALSMFYIEEKRNVHF